MEDRSFLYSFNISGNPINDSLYTITCDRTKTRSLWDRFVPSKRFFKFCTVQIWMLKTLNEVFHLKAKLSGLPVLHAHCQTQEKRQLSLSWGVFVRGNKWNPPEHHRWKHLSDADLKNVTIGGCANFSRKLRASIQKCRYMKFTHLFVKFTHLSPKLIEILI